MAKEQQAKTSDGPPSFWGALMPVLSFVGTGIGLIGFVIFFGGFVLWTRFDEVGLPADEAVWHVPKADLVTTGASFLVPAVALGAIVVAVAFMARAWIIGKRQQKRVRNASKEVSEKERALEKARNTARAAAREDEEKRPSLNKAYDLYDSLSSTAVTEEERKSATASRDENGRLRDALAAATYDSAQQAADADAALEDARRRLAEDSELTRGEKTGQWVLGGLAIVAVSAVYVGLTSGDLLTLMLVAVLATALFVLVLSATVLEVTSSYSWFALSAFVGVGVVVAVSTYARTHDKPKVSPVAVLANGVPHVGYLVAESDDAVYLAQPSPKADEGKLTFDHDRTRLVRLDKKQVTSLVVGPLAAEDTAYRLALQTAAELCTRVKPPTGGAPTATVVTTTAEPKRGKGRTTTTKRATAPKAGTRGRTTVRAKRTVKAGAGTVPAVAPDERVCSTDDRSALARRMAAAGSPTKPA